MERGGRRYEYLKYLRSTYQGNRNSREREDIGKPINGPEKKWSFSFKIIVEIEKAMNVKSKRICSASGDVFNISSENMKLDSGYV